MSMPLYESEASITDRVRASRQRRSAVDFAMKGLADEVKVSVHEESMPVAGDVAAVAAARASIETAMRELSASVDRIQEELLLAGDVLANAFGLSEPGCSVASYSLPSFKTAPRYRQPDTRDPPALAAATLDSLPIFRQECPGDEVSREASRCSPDVKPVDLARQEAKDSWPGRAISPTLAATTLDSLPMFRQKERPRDESRQEASRRSPDEKPVELDQKEARDSLSDRKLGALPQTHHTPKLVATTLDSLPIFRKKDRPLDEVRRWASHGEANYRSVDLQPVGHAESYDDNAPTKVMVSTGSSCDHGVDAETLPETWPASLDIRLRPEVTGRRTSSSALKPWYSRRRHRLTDIEKHSLQQPALGSGKRLSAIHPNSNVRVMYDLGCAVILALDFVIIPWMVAWDIDLDGGLYYMAFASAAFWTFDIGMSFVTGYTTREECVLDPLAIWWHYLRSWFVPDTAIVMCDWVTLAIEGSADWRTMRLAKVGRLLRLSALVRMLKLAHTVSDFVDDKLSDFAQLSIRLAKMIFTTLAYSHIMCCIWFFIGRAAPTDTGVRWIDSRKLVEESMWYQYATSFHWAMAQLTLGATEVSSNSFIERVYGVLCLLLGLLFCSTLVSSLSAMMLEAQMDKRGTHQKMLLLRRYLRENKVERKLASLVERQLAERLVERERVKEEQVTGLALLSSSLRSQLRFHLCAPYLQRHPLFQLWVSIDKTFVERFCRTCMDFVHLRAQDDLFAAGKLAECAYFFISGSVTYTQEPHSSPLKATTVQNVGPGCWVAEAALWSHWVHVGTAHATHLSEFACVHVARIMEVMRWTTTIIELTSDYCQKFHRRLQAAKPPTLEWPDDLQVPLTDWSDMVLAMDPGSQLVIGLESIRHAAMSSVWLKATLGLDRLNQEVKEGRSVVMLNSEGGLERVVSVVALKIYNDRGEFLAQIGKEDGGRMVPACQLPGSKQGVGEIPADTMERVLTGKLAHIEAHLDVTHLTRRTEWKDAKEGRVQTKYLRYIVHSKLDSGFDLDSTSLPVVPHERLREAVSEAMHAESQQVKPPTPSSPAGRRAWETFEGIQRQISAFTNSGDTTLSFDAATWELGNRPVFCMQDSNGMNCLYAWFTEEDFGKLRGPIGERLIPGWLASLAGPSISEGSLKSADLFV